MDFLLLEEVDSTNSYVSRHAGDLKDMTMVMAARQTAGRGQRGNSWESEPGANLTFTLFYRPADFEAKLQFSISEAVALAAVDFLATLGVEAKVKWPNDIYVDDRKISGILIEHSVSGRTIDHSRIGMGINLNQVRFLSDAPNPVSVKMLTGRTTDISLASASLGHCIERRLQDIATPIGRETLHNEFLEKMWRADGKEYAFREPAGSVFYGRIEEVSPDGPICIRNVQTGQRKQYAFKEIEFVLK